MTTTDEANAAEQKHDQIHLELSTGGTVVMDLLPELAPKHVERLTTLTQEGFYDGIVFHRVIDGFMAQTGDPTGTGMGGSDNPDVPAEFSSYRYKRGTVGMARSANPDSANSQFFICFDDTGCSGLTGDYTVFAQVTDGMEFVDSISRTASGDKPDSIIKATFVAAE